MTKKYKVYGGIIMRSKQLRVIVATTTKKRASELFNISYYYFKDYCCETGNEQEVKLCLAFPNVVFCKECNDWNGEYIPLERIKNEK